jgi:polynucleotide 5'-kinase involved in rRNA processing
MEFKLPVGLRVNNNGEICPRVSARLIFILFKLAMRGQLVAATERRTFVSSPDAPRHSRSLQPGQAVILVSGIQASGKSTVAQLLAERLPRSVHVGGMS